MRVYHLSMKQLCHRDTKVCKIRNSPAKNFKNLTAEMDVTRWNKQKNILVKFVYSQN